MTLQDDLIRDEGMKLKPYTDTVGKLTIGVGRNLTDNGVTPDEARAMLTLDISRHNADLTANIPWWLDMPEPARRGLSNICFNIGWPRLSGFHNMLAALKEGRWDDAGSEALASAWATQVGARAERIAALFRSCAKNG